MFSDPGQLLVRKAIDAGIKVVPIPGASSLMPALTVSGFSIDQFVFYGWLSPKRPRRIAELQQLKRERRTIVLMDTPYRLIALLKDISDTFGSSRRLCIAFDLTLPDEEIFHGTGPSLLEKLTKLDKKGEFVVVIESTNQIVSVVRLGFMFYVIWAIIVRRVDNIRQVTIRHFDCNFFLQNLQLETSEKSSLAKPPRRKESIFKSFYVFA